MNRLSLLLLAACAGSGQLEPSGEDPTQPTKPTTAPTGTDPTGTTPDPTGTTTPTTSTTTPTTTAPAPFVAPFLWAPITFDDAVDLGHVPAAVAAPTPPGPITMTEVGQAAGLGGVLSAGNTHGVGVGWVDFDGDGWEDVVVVSGQLDGMMWPSQLWRNDGDGTFSDATVSSGLGPILANRDGYSVAAADYDADGDVDLYVTTHPTDVLLQNQGDGTFVDVTDDVGAGGPSSMRDGSGASKIAAWGDVDGDGWLDVVVASSTFDAVPGNAYLLRNLGDGTFEDATAATGAAVAPTGNPCAVMWSDYDDDADQDVFVFNDRGTDTQNRALLRNDGGVFTNVTAAAGLGMSLSNPMGIDAADIDRDDHLDYYVSNITLNRMLMGQAGGTFIDASGATGTSGGYGWGLSFEDFDADGWWDLFVAQEDDRAHRLYHHGGAVPVEYDLIELPHPPVDDADHHNVAAAFADYDHDGRTDVVTAGTGGTRVLLWHNDTDLGDNRWLRVRVPESPVLVENGGLTARVAVSVGGVVLWRDLTGGSSRASQNAHDVRFGLGAWTGADWVAALWPDGRQVVYTNVEGNQVLELLP